MGAKTVPRGAKSHMQNPYCYFSMDEPIGSFSPVQGDFGALLKIISLYEFDWTFQINKHP